MPLQQYPMFKTNLDLSQAIAELPVLILADGLV